MDPVLERYDLLLSRFTAENFPPLIIAVGLGDGQLLEAIERRSPTTKVLALEPFGDANRSIDARQRAWLASGRLTRLVGPEYHGRADAWRLIDRRALKPPMLVSPAFEKGNAAEVAAAKSVAKQIVLGAQSNDEARRRFSGSYLLNTIANLPFIATEGNAADLAQLFDGMPAVVVGAGPSLDANLEALEDIQDRAIIITVDTAIRPLLAAGIRPHFVVGVDPSDDNARHLRDLPETRGIWFVAEPSLPTQVFWQFTDRTFLYKVSQHHPWPWLNAHGLDCGKLEAWGSVITTAFDLACRLGCDPIAFAGADLAYTNGLPYCRNTVYEPEWRGLTTDAARADAFKEHLAKKGTITTRDLAGDETVSAPRFIQFRDWLVARAERERTRRIVNATGAGILYGGRIEQADLESLRLPEATRTREEIHQRIRAAWNAAVDREERSRTASAAMDAQRHDVVAAWLTECGETAPAEQIVASLGLARQRLTRLAQRLAFVSKRRDYYITRIASADDAQTLSHGDYANGRLQSAHYQAHLLLEYLQRTYKLQPPATIREVVDAATAMAPTLRALDVGCGAGRDMESMVDAGFRVDGVDLSPAMIECARQNPKLKDCEFFLSNGHDCGDAPDGAYDLAFSTACFQFIPVRGLRLNLLRTMARALRPGGVAVIHLRFHPQLPSARVSTSWAADDFARIPAGDLPQVWPTAEALPNIYRDFTHFFHDVRFQIVELDAAPDGSWPYQLIVSGSTKRSVAERMHPALTADAA